MTEPPKIKYPKKGVFLKIKNEINGVIDYDIQNNPKVERAHNTYIKTMEKFFGTSEFIYKMGVPMFDPDQSYRDLLLSHILMRRVGFSLFSIDSITKNPHEMIRGVEKMYKCLKRENPKVFKVFDE